MSTALSVAEILDKLAKQISWHRERAEFHTEQEARHRQQSAFHTADLAQAGAPQPVVEEEEDVGELGGKRIMVSKLVARAVERLGEGETFGAKRVAAETNRRFQSRLRRPVDARAASVVLRRLHAAGRLQLIRPGKASQEALYMKPPVTFSSLATL